MPKYLIAILTMPLLLFWVKGFAQNQNPTFPQMEVEFFYRQLEMAENYQNIGDCDCENNPQIRYWRLDGERSFFDSLGNQIIFHDLLIISEENAMFFTPLEKRELPLSKEEKVKVIGEFNELTRKKLPLSWNMENYLLCNPRPSLIFIEYCKENKLKVHHFVNWLQAKSPEKITLKNKKKYHRSIDELSQMNNLIKLLELCLPKDFQILKGLDAHKFPHIQRKKARNKN